MPNSKHGRPPKATAASRHEIAKATAIKLKTAAYARVAAAGTRLVSTEASTLPVINTKLAAHRQRVLDFHQSRDKQATAAATAGRRLLGTGSTAYSGSGGASRVAQTWQLGLMGANGSGGVGLPRGVCQVGPFESPKSNQFLSLQEAADWAAANYPEGCLIQVFPLGSNSTDYEEDVLVTSNVTFKGMGVETATQASSGSYYVWVDGTITVQASTDNTSPQVACENIGVKTFEAMPASIGGVAEYVRRLEFLNCQIGDLLVVGPVSVSAVDSMFGFRDETVFVGDGEVPGPFVSIHGGVVREQVLLMFAGLEMFGTNMVDGSMSIQNNSAVAISGCTCISREANYSINVQGSDEVPGSDGSILAAHNCSFDSVSCYGQTSSTAPVALVCCFANRLSLGYNEGSNATAMVSSSTIAVLEVAGLEVPSEGSGGSKLYSSRVGLLQLSEYAVVDLIDTSYDLDGSSWGPNVTLGRSPVVITGITADGTYNIFPQLLDSQFFVTFTQVSGTASPSPVLVTADTTRSALVVSGVVADTEFRALITRVPVGSNAP